MNFTFNLLIELSVIYHKYNFIKNYLIRKQLFIRYPFSFDAIYKHKQYSKTKYLCKFLYFPNSLK